MSLDENVPHSFSVVNKPDLENSTKPPVLLRSQTCAKNEYDQSTSSSQNTDCIKLTECERNQYQSVAPTLRDATQRWSDTNSYITDRVCTNLTACNSNQYDINQVKWDGTATQNTNCDSTVACVDGEDLSTPPATRDGNEQGPTTPYQNKGVCTTKNGYYCVESATSDRTCTLLRKCGPGQFLSRTNDCSECKPYKGTFLTYNTYQDQTNHTETSCKVKNMDCNHETQFIQHYNDLTRNSVCVNLRQCGNNEYESKKPTKLFPDWHFKISDRECLPKPTAKPTCNQGEFLKNSSKTTSGKCSECPANTFQDNTNHQETSCKKKTWYCLDERFIKHHNDKTRNGKCVDLTQCEDNQYESKEPEKQFPNFRGGWFSRLKSSDRTCADCTDIPNKALNASVRCTGANNSRLVVANNSRLTGNCEAGYWKDSSGTSDVCKALTECGTGEAESIAPTPTSDRECSPQIDCKVGELCTFITGHVRDNVNALLEENSHPMRYDANSLVFGAKSGKYFKMIKTDLAGAMKETRYTQISPQQNVQNITSLWNAKNAKTQKGSAQAVGKKPTECTDGYYCVQSVKRN